MTYSAHEMRARGRALLEAFDEVAREWLAQEDGLPAPVLLGAWMFAIGGLSGLILDTVKAPEKLDTFFRGVRSCADEYLKAPRTVVE